MCLKKIILQSLDRALIQTPLSINVRVVGTRQPVPCLVGSMSDMAAGCEFPSKLSSGLVSENISQARNSSLEKGSEKNSKNYILSNYYKLIQNSDIPQSFIVVSPAYQNSVL